jgi:hypothetical protein
MPQQWLTSPIAKLQTLLGSLSAFQTFVDAGDAVTAEASVYYPETSERPIPIEDLTGSQIDLLGDHTNVIKAGQHIRIVDNSNTTDTVNGAHKVTFSLTGFPGTSVLVSDDMGAITANDGYLIPNWMPRVVIGPNGGRMRRRVGATNFNTEGGGLYLMFQDEPSDTRWDPANEVDDVQGAYDDFAGSVQSIMDALESAQGVNDALAINGIEEVDPVMQIHERFNHGRPYWHCQFVLTTGR